MGQFIACIGVGYKGPCAFLMGETEQEKQDALLDVLKRNTEIRDQLAAEFKAREASKATAREGKKARGKPVSLDVYICNNGFKKRKRDKGGVDGYRLGKFWMESNLIPALESRIQTERLVEV